MLTTTTEDHLLRTQRRVIKLDMNMRRSRRALQRKGDLTRELKAWKELAKGRGRVKTTPEKDHGMRRTQSSVLQSWNAQWEENVGKLKVE